MPLKRVSPFISAALFLVIAGCTSMGTNNNPEKTARNAPLSRDELANATYHGIATHPITLSNGHWQGEPYQPGGASRPTVGLLDKLILHADLNGDGRSEAIVMLWQNTGGSGTRLYLAVLSREDNNIVNQETTDIGDRPQIIDAHIEDRGIVLDVVQAGPDDAACCPGQKARRSWMLANNDIGKIQLKEMPAYLTGRLSLADIEHIEWQLQAKTNHVDIPSVTTPATTSATSPAITLRIDKQRISGFGGCNRYQATVTAGEQPGSLKISDALTTQMACPDGDMQREDQYLKRLSSVSHFSFRAGELLLTVSDTKNTGKTSPLVFQRKP